MIDFLEQIKQDINQDISQIMNKHRNITELKRINGKVYITLNFLIYDTSLDYVNLEFDSIEEMDNHLTYNLKDIEIDLYKQNHLFNIKKIRNQRTELFQLLNKIMKMEKTK